MSHRILALILACAVTFIASSAAAECIEEEPFWYATEYEDPHTMTPEGPIVFAAYFSGSTSELQNTPVNITVSDAEGEISGTSELILEESGTPRLVWTPDEPVTAGTSLTAAYDDFGGFGRIQIEVVESIDPPVVTIEDLERREFEVAAERRCCFADAVCDDPCAGQCESCATTIYEYPIRAGFTGSFEYAAVNDLYMLVWEIVQADGTPFEDSIERYESTTLDLFSPYSNSLPEDAEGFCVKHTIRNVVTGEDVTSDLTCSETTGLATASRNDTQTLDTSVCDADFVRVISSDGTVEQVPIDEPGAGGGGGTGVGTKPETGGCATGSGGPTGILLVFIGLLAAGYRRRN